jgi:hypothetical protein
MATVSFYSSSPILCPSLLHSHANVLIVREIHISLNFASAERARPFNEPQYGVRNNNMIIWTAVLGVYLLYSALMVMVYEWYYPLSLSSLPLFLIFFND